MNTFSTIFIRLKNFKMYSSNVWVWMETWKIWFMDWSTFFLYIDSLTFPSWIIFISNFVQHIQVWNTYWIRNKLRKLELSLAPYTWTQKHFKSQSVDWTETETQRTRTRTQNYLVLWAPVSVGWDLNIFWVQVNCWHEIARVRSSWCEFSIFKISSDFRMCRVNDAFFTFS